MQKPSRETIVRALDDLVNAVRGREVRGTVSQSQLLEVTERAYLVVERERAENEDKAERPLSS